MQYYDDLVFVSANHVADCQAVVNERLPYFCALNLLAGGSIELAQDDGPPTRLDAPALYWTWEQPVWRYHRVGAAGWNHYWVAFHGERVARMQALGMLPAVPLPAAPLPGSTTAPQLMQRLVRLVRQRDPREHGEAVQLLERLLLLAHQHAAGPVRSEALDQQLERIAEGLRAAPFGDWHFPEVAADIGVSYSYFRHRFRRQLSASPHAYLLRCRMVTVAAAIDTLGSIKAAAYEHGYHDLANFNRSFSRVMGVTPRQYQRSLQR
jgi:AraC-like DNA-binding protein